MNKTFLICILIFIGGCQTTPFLQTTPAIRLTEVSTDDSYGYTEGNPIKVGGYATLGARNEYIYLRMLTGPNGEPIQYRRQGNCCAFKTDNSSYGNWTGNKVGLLDVFQITYDGLDKPVTLYINGYDYAQPKAPIGFSFKTAANTAPQSTH